MASAEGEYGEECPLPSRLGGLGSVVSSPSGVQGIDREFVTSAKKIANFNEFSEIKKIRKNSYKNSLNARVGVAFQQQLQNLMRFTVSSC